MAGRLIAIAIDEPTGAVADTPIEEERRVAVRDLVAGNAFSPKDAPETADGRFRLAVSSAGDHFVFEIADGNGAPLDRFDLPLTPLRALIRDYMIVCDSYRKGLATLRPEQIEAIDMGRRGLHNDGAEVVREQLASRVEVDHDTARRLFTLVCALQARA